MGFKGNRIYILAGAIALLVIIGIAWSAANSQGTIQQKKQATDPISCTINPSVGISNITVTNMNTGKSITKTSVNLPYIFNFTKGDTLRFSVALDDAYNWNAFELNQYPWFAQDNPFIMSQIDVALVLNPQCIPK